jgi:hypothetical protein
MYWRDTQIDVDPLMLRSRGAARLQADLKHESDPIMAAFLRLALLVARKPYPTHPEAWEAGVCAVAHSLWISEGNFAAAQESTRQDLKIKGLRQEYRAGQRAALALLGR